MKELVSILLISVVFVVGIGGSAALAGVLFPMSSHERRNDAKTFFVSLWIVLICVTGLIFMALN